MKGKNQDIQDIICHICHIFNFVTADDSYLSGLSDSDQELEAIIKPQKQDNSDEEIDEDISEECDNDKPISELAVNPAPRIYRWRLQDTPHRAYEFAGKYSLPPDTPLTLLQYCCNKFLTKETMNYIVENTNLLTHIGHKNFVIQY